MQEKAWISTVVGIGERGHILLHEVQSRMESEKDDAMKGEDIMLCRLWHIPTGSTIAKEALEENCRGIGIAFFLMDASDEESAKYAQCIADFIKTQYYAVSIAILPDSCAKTTDSILSSVDAVVDLSACVSSGGFTQAYMAYCVIRGINGLIVKAGLIGLDAVDLAEQLHKTGLLHVGYGNVGTDHDDEAIATATKDALSQIKCTNVKRIVLCFEGKVDTLNMIDICSSVETVEKAMPDASILYGATKSESTGDMVRVLIVASEIPLE